MGKAENMDILVHFSFLLGFLKIFMQVLVIVLVWATSVLFQERERRLQVDEPSLLAAARFSDWF